MQNQYVDIRSVSELLQFYNYGKPGHPLIAIIDLAKANPDRSKEETHYRTAFYAVMCKRFKGILKYGRSHYDFEEGSLMFTAPNQVITASPDIRDVEGWGLFFHPDLIAASPLGQKIDQYSFFNYDSNEALHVSDEENQTLMDVLELIRKEYQQHIDKHTNTLINDNLQLLLNYCERFYDRQFLTRVKVNNDIVQRFEKMVKEYFHRETLVNDGLPDVKLFASQLNLSSGYLSDLLKKYTGKTTQEHIYLALIDKAKILLLGTSKPVSEIGYDLGFEHPSHFTKLFKSKTGKSPREFRLN